MTEKKLSNLDFSKMLYHLKLGAKCFRSGWNGQRQFIRLQVPENKSKMTMPYIYFITQTGDMIPWVASQTDLLSSDWNTVI
jgi:hypothetical protein